MGFTDRSLIPTGTFLNNTRLSKGTNMENSLLLDLEPPLVSKSSSSAPRPAGHGTDRNRSGASPASGNMSENSSNFPFATIHSGFLRGRAKSSLTGRRDQTPETPICGLGVVLEKFPVCSKEFPLIRWHLVFIEYGVDRANGLAVAAVDTDLGIDVIHLF